MPKTVPTGPGLEPGKYPFSPIVEAHGFVFLSGQIGDEPGSSGPVTGGIDTQTRRALENVGRLLGAVGLDFTDVVKCTVYLTDIGDFAAMNAVYAKFFPTEPPTRATVQVGALALDAKIEIEALASR